MFAKPFLSTVSWSVVLGSAVLTLYPDIQFFAGGLLLAVVCGIIHFWTAVHPAEEERKAYWLRFAKGTSLAFLAGLMCGLWTYELIASQYPGIWFGMLAVSGYSGQKAIDFFATLLESTLTRIRDSTIGSTNPPNEEQDDE